MSLATVCEALETAPFSQAIEGSTFWWPAIESAHLVALTVLVGSITAFDVRLLGLGLRHVRVSRLGERLLPCTWFAFAASVVTGTLMFISEAHSKYCFNYAFRVKLLLILLAGLNMSVFHFTIYRSGLKWDEGAATPLWAKLVGSASTLLWLGVVIAGRWIGFVDTGI
jgi:hypothetical protein